MSSYLKSILTEAAEGALVLTSNKRLSRFLRGRFDQWMLQQGRKAWPTPQILSLDAWFDRRASDLGLRWRLLQGHAEKRVWEQIIEEDSRGSEKELLQLAPTAEKARQAAQLLVEYQVSLEGLPLTEDQQYFKKWHQKYERLCSERGWLDRAGLAYLVFDAIRTGTLDCPQSLLLTGFDQDHPQLSKLREVVQELGGRILSLEADVATDLQAGRVCAMDPRHEIEIVACWARQMLEQGEVSIGIVVADLQARRRQIERVFRDQIDPAAALKRSGYEPVFGLSLGSSLSEQGPVFSALEILSIGPRLSLEQISGLLRNPYLKGCRSEADRRALFDRRLRSFRQKDFSLQTLMNQTTAEKTPASCRIPLFSSVLEGLATVSGASRTQLPGAWAAEFDALLRDDKVGWPGERPLSSNEYQMVSAWHDKLLPALASLDTVTVPMTRQQALGLLRRLAAETDFQLETPAGPIQVLGLLESAGLEFDHLWVMGMTENALPAPSRPNPFLPVALQVKHKMPHGSATRELDFARQVLTRLKLASPDILFSYAAREGDCELRPSPLIADLPLVTLDTLQSQDIRTRIAREKTALEALSDEQGTPLVSGQGEGGTGILKDQAICPFRAFAHYRLRARDFDQAESGLDAMTRGDLLHKALEVLWRQLGDQQHLLSLAEEARRTLITQAVTQAIEHCLGDSLPQVRRLIDLEQERLEALVTEWLSGFEQTRAPFQVVAVEEEHRAQIGPLQIRIVVDRVDRLTDGSLFILDYKTGVVKADLILGERLLEPQLPLYAISSTSYEPDGVAFAQLRRGACKLIGVAREDALLPGLSGVSMNRKAQELGLADWDQLLRHWKQQLEAVADDFVSGVAPVDPVDPVMACTYCDLSGLCRIAESEYTGESQ